MLLTALTKPTCLLKLGLRILLVSVLLPSLFGCARFLMGEKILDRNPLENPTINVTNFSQALSCMDELLINYDTPTITITAQDIPNMTGNGDNIAGTKDMLITSISKLSEKSRRIRFVSYGTDLRDIILLHKTHEKREQFITPDYFIRGAITQLDKNVFSSRIGTAAHDDGWNTAFSGGQGVSFAAMDLNIGKVSDLQMIAGATSNNVLAIWDRGAGVDLGGRIKSVGTFFDFGIDRRDGMGQAIRNMTDLAVIEVIGKLLEVPYLTCLPLNHHSAQVHQMIEKEYDSYVNNPSKLIRVVQARLKQLGLFHGQANGVMTRETALALEYFHSLYRPQGLAQKPKTIDFQLYYDLMYGKQPRQPAPQIRYAGYSTGYNTTLSQQLSFELETKTKPETKKPAQLNRQPQLNKQQHKEPRNKYQSIIDAYQSPPGEQENASTEPAKKQMLPSKTDAQIEPMKSLNQAARSPKTQPTQPEYDEKSISKQSADFTDEPLTADYWEQRFTKELNTQGRFKPRSVQEVIQGM